MLGKEIHLNWLLKVLLFMHTYHIFEQLESIANFEQCFARPIRIMDTIHKKNMGRIKMVLQCISFATDHVIYVM